MELAMTGCHPRMLFPHCITILLLTLLFYPGVGASASVNNSIILWVASGNSVFNVSPNDGAPKLVITPISDIQALSVDEPDNLIWIYGRKHLWAYDALGELLLSADMPRAFNGSDPVALILDSSSGNAWIGIHKSIYRLDFGGNLIATVNLDHNIRSVTFDNNQSILWVALDDKFILIDKHGNFIFTKDLNHNSKTLSITYDSSLNQVWLATKYHLSRYNNAGVMVSDVQLNNAENLDKYSAIDAQGGIWLAGDRYLAHFNADGQQEYKFIPFGGHDDDEHAITGIAADINSHTVWITDRRYLYQYDVNGNLIQQFDSHNWKDHQHKFKHDDDSRSIIHHLAIYNGPHAPIISITNPVNNSYTNYSQPNISITYIDAGSGVDPGSISITSNNVPLHATCQATDNGAQCTPVEGMPDGMYSLSATVTDNAGNVSDPALVSFIVDTTPPVPPSGNLIGFQSDSNGGLILLGQAGSVNPDTISLTITNIRTGKTIIGSINENGSFSVAVSGAGSDEFMIVLRDKAGNSSTPVFMHGSDQPLQLVITSPVPDSSIAGDVVNVTGTFQGVINAGIKVNGIPAILSNHDWVANNVTLQPGVNTLEVIATTGGGVYFSQSIQVTSTGSTQLILNSNPTSSGIAPLQISYQYQFLLNKPISQLEIDYTGNGTFIQITDTTTILSYTYTASGIYPVTLRLTDSDNLQYQAHLLLVVQDTNQLDALFHGIWGDFTTALVSGNKQAVMHVLDGTAGRNYGPAFDVLMPHMKDIVESFSPLLRSSVSSSYGEYAIVRERNGQQNLFLVYFIKDQDGVWRLDAM